MKIGRLTVRLFKLKNRKGYAAVCAGHLTEGRSKSHAFDRMLKAVSRTKRQRR